MIDVHNLARALDPEERAKGMPGLASFAGASQMCIFLRDPKLHKYLPAPGFPQTLPAGLLWASFLKRAAAEGVATDTLPSPFSPTASQVTGRVVGEGVMLVLFGSPPSEKVQEELTPAVQIASALLQCERELREKTLEVRMADARAVEARQLSLSLSEAHDRLSAALQRGHDLSQAVHRQQETLDLARQISGIGLWTFDFTEQAFSLSGHAASIFGLKASETRIPLPVFLERVHPEDRRLVEEAFTSDHNSEPHNLHFRLYREKETLRWIENRGVITNDDTGKPQLNGLSLDVTDRIKTEEALIRSEKLAAAGRLAATIAHEINNPLESLVNLIYIASTSDDLANIRELLAQAEREIVRVSEVARQTLAFYRDMNRPVEFDLRTAIDQSLRILHQEAQKRNITSIADICRNPAIVRGSIGELKQVFSNLFLNAVQASEPGTRILTRIRANSKRVVVLVADQGHGISEKNLSRVFEPFFSTRKEGGTGLGLWVSQQIIQKHGGAMFVRSRTGSTCHGTVFRIVLPLANESAEPDSTGILRYRWLELTS